MTKQQKLDAIYEAMADKTLSMGCNITTADKDYNGSVKAIAIKKIEGVTSWSGYDKTDDCISVYIPFGGRNNSGKFKPMVSFAKNKMTIIGHPVYIGYVLEYIHTMDGWHLRDELFGKWGKFRLPIDDQSDECIDFVYSLITK